MVARPGSAAVWLLLVCAAAAVPQLSTAFQDGDFVPIARRGQFHEVRTHWHDLLGRHCPHFGRDRVVAVPIPQPQGFKAVDGYKIAFSVAGDRLYTPWLKLISNNGVTPTVPLLDFRLTRMGNDIKSVSAQVTEVPPHYLERHAGLTAEWTNATDWPKHLLIEYHWAEEHEVNAIPGMYVLFATGYHWAEAHLVNAIPRMYVPFATALAAGLVLAVAALSGSSDKLRELVDDVVGDGDFSGGVWSPDPSNLGGPPVFRPAAAPKGD